MKIFEQKSEKILSYHAKDLKKAREDAGLTMRSLGELAGVSYTLIWKLENHKARANKALAERITTLIERKLKP